MNDVILSRPDELLVDHCRLVAGRSGESCGWIHDLGKSTEWFQRYIDPTTEASAVDLSMRTHSRVGGYVAYYCARQRGDRPKHALSDAIIVAKHHSNIPNAINYIREQLPGEKAWIGRARTALERTPIDATDPRSTPEDHNVKALAQVRNIDADDAQRSVANRLIEGASGGAGSWDEFVTEFTSGDLQAEMRTAPMKHALTASFDRDAFVSVSNDKSGSGSLEDEKGQWYEDVLQGYASIQLADGTAAGGVSDEALRAPQWPTDAIHSHVDRISSGATSAGVEGALNAIRGGVQDHVISRLRSGLADDLDSGGAVRLTLNTGYGKTLTSGLFAEELLAHRQSDHDRGGRVVYALPFTTIADQTAGVFGDAFESAGIDTDDEPLVLSIDHHRTESPTDRVAEEREVSHRAAETILSSWRSLMTVTTIVQLFESVVGPWRSQSTKLPALANSIIIVDEPQAIPIAWRPLISRAIETLIEEYNAVVLLMTATQPFLVDDESSRLGIVDLISAEKIHSIEREAMDDAGIDEIPSRVRYHFDDSAMFTSAGSPPEGAQDKEYRPRAPITHQDAGSRIVEAFVGDRESALAICNSIESTRTLTDEVESQLISSGFTPLQIGSLYEDLLDPSDTRSSIEAVSVDDLVDEIESTIENGSELVEVPVFHLSRQIPSTKLFTMIEAARRLTERADSIAHIVVSTQLVEAGVDISYRRLYRDFAPLDSIVQAAGRCNRSFEWGIDGGDVMIWTLEPPGEGTKLPSEAVYNRSRGDRASVSVNTLRRSRTAINDLYDRLGDSGPDGFAEDDLSVAVEDYHRDLASVLSAVSEDEDALLRAHSRGNGRTLRESSMIDERLEVSIVVCATKGNRILVSEYRSAVENDRWETATRLRRQLTQLSVSVPVYELGSSRWKTVSGMEPLIQEEEEEKEDARVVDRSMALVNERDGIKIE